MLAKANAKPTVSFSAYCLNRLLLVIRLPFSICHAVFHVIAPSIWPTGCYRGIRTLDFNRETRSSFSQKINEALALIEQNDPRRFERVRREIRLIVYDRWRIVPLPPGAYFPLAKACLINLKRFDFSKHPKWQTALLAALIVHEATHGHLRRKRMLNVNRIQVSRVEALCNKEERRMLSKLGYDLRGFDMFKDTNRNDPQYVQRWGEFFDKLP